MKRFILLPATMLALLSVGALPPERNASVPETAEIAVAYKSYRKMTEKAVLVNPELAMLCIGASQNQVEAARKIKGPHAHSAIEIYLNDIAAKDFSRGDASYAPGAVIVKQKTLLGYRDGKSGAWVGATNHGVGGMVKRPKGYDPAHGDWEYFYFEDASKIESGRIPSCIACHDAAKGTDYIFGTWMEPRPKKG